MAIAPQGPGTHVATRTPEQRAEREAWLLSPERQALIEERKAINLVATKVAGLSWGSAFDQKTCRMLAEYGRQRGIDVVTEIHILGGRIYKNADFYINRAQPLILNGTLALDHEYVNHDRRLDELAKSDNPETAQAARDERERRLWRRIAFNIPDSAQSAVIASLTICRTGRKIEAAKWCGGGVNKGDPVGDAKPEATSVTRAYRKVLKLAVGHEPSIGMAIDPNDDEVLAEFEEVIDERRSIQEANQADARANQQRALRNIVSPDEGVAEIGTIEVNTDVDDPYDAAEIDPNDPNYFDVLEDER